MDTKRIKISFILVIGDNLLSSVFWHILFLTFLYLILCIGIISKIFFNRNTCLLKFSFTSECFSQIKRKSRIVFNIEHYKRTNYLCFPGGSEVKASACDAGDLGLIPGLRRSFGGGNGNPLQHSCLANAMDRGAWWATVHGVADTDSTVWAGHMHL